MDRLDSEVRHVERMYLCRGRVSWVRGDHSTSSSTEVGSLHVSRQLSLPFVPAVLEPDLDLRNVERLVPD